MSQPEEGRSDRQVMKKNRTVRGVKRRRPESGVVLVAVLWICALVMWFTLQIGVMTRMEGEEQVHLFRRSQAYYLAIGGCYEALARMGQPPPTGLERGPDLSWQPDGSPHLIEYQTGDAEVSIEVETRKVNVNLTPPEQLALVFIEAGFDEKAVAELVDVIADFIDPDDQVRLHGMEKAGYQRRGTTSEPFNGPLLSIDQLLLIPGITEELLYGYLQGGKEGEERSPRHKAGSVLPAQSSLFQMLTVYGRNTSLPQPDLEQALGERIIPWENGGIYRIYATGRALSGPPAVSICLIVRYAPQSKQGYEVLHRKIL